MKAGRRVLENRKYNNSSVSHRLSSGNWSTKTNMDCRKTSKRTPMFSQLIMLIYWPGDPSRKAEKVRKLVFLSVLPVLAHKQKKLTRRQQGGTSSDGQTVCEAAQTAAICSITVKGNPELVPCHLTPQSFTSCPCQSSRAAATGVAVSPNVCSFPQLLALG